MSETDQPNASEEFSKVRKHGCSLEKQAKIQFATPPWDSDLSLEENLARSIESLNGFIENVEKDKLDIWIFTICDRRYSINLRILAKTTNRILSYLSDNDPARTNILGQAIETSEWKFSYANVKFFIIVMAPCYPHHHPRSSHSEILSYFLFQPIISFKRLNIKEHGSMRMRTAIRRDFARRGSPLDEDLMDTEFEAYKYVKPIEIGDSPIKWWLP